NLTWVGISLGWGWSAYSYPTGSYANSNQINGNLVHDVSQLLQYERALYNPSFQPGSSSTGNYIQNLGAGDTNGIYHDEGSRFFTDTSNVVSGAPRWLSMWINTVLNNT